MDHDFERGERKEERGVRIVRLIRGIRSFEFEEGEGKVRSNLRREERVCLMFTETRSHYDYWSRFFLILLHVSAVAVLEFLSASAGARVIASRHLFLHDRYAVLACAFPCILLCCRHLIRVGEVILLFVIPL